MQTNLRQIPIVVDFQLYFPSSTWQPPKPIRVLFNYEPNTILELGSVQFTYPCKDHAAIESLRRQSGWDGPVCELPALGDEVLDLKGLAKLSARLSTKRVEG